MWQSSSLPAASRQKIERGQRLRHDVSVQNCASAVWANLPATLSITGSTWPSGDPSAHLVLQPPSSATTPALVIGTDTECAHSTTTCMTRPQYDNVLRGAVRLSFRLLKKSQCLPRC